MRARGRLLGLAAALVAAPAHAAAAAGGARPLGDILRELVREPLRIVWSSETVDPALRVRDLPAEGPLAVRLDDLLSGFGLAAVEAPASTWTVLRRDDPAAQGSLTVRVSDRATRAPLAGVEVAIAGGSRLPTGVDGVARFAALAPGRLALKVGRPGGRAAGAVRRRLRLLPGHHERIEVEVESATETGTAAAELPVTSETIVVTPSRTSLLRDDAVGAVDVTAEEIRRLPHLGDDLFRAAARLPGAVGDDFSAALGVRGGEAREVVLRVDGVEVPRPWHLPDLQNAFGIVDSSIVDALDLYSGGFPAEFGGVQSGVLDARTRSPSAPSQVELGVSFLTARAVVGGAFGGGGSWLAAARRGYLDLVLQRVDPNGELEPAYGDLFAKVERPLGRHSLAALETFALEDRERFTSDEPGEERLLGRASGGTTWVRVETALGSELFGRTVVGWTRREQERSGFANRGRATLRDERSLDDWVARQEWTWEARDSQRLKAGWSASRVRADYDFSSARVVDDPVILRGEAPRTIALRSRLFPEGEAWGLYVANRWAPSRRFAVEVGGRFDRQSWLREGGGAEQVSPRLQLLWRTGTSTELRAAWGRYSQPQRVDELQVEDGVETFNPVEVAEHRVLSLARVLPRAGSLRIEAYDKRLPRPAPRFENLFDPIELFPSLEEDRVGVEPQRARLRGVEAAWSQRPSPRTRFSAAYVWSRSEDLVKGRWTPRRFDQTHSATAIFALVPNDRWSVELVHTYHTGWPTTAATLALVPGPGGQPVLGVVLGPRNGERFPDYQRLDLRVRRSRATARGAFDLYFEAFNLLDRDNVCCVNGFELTPADGPVPALSVSHDYWLPLVPSFGVVWRRP